METITPMAVTKATRARTPTRTVRLTRKAAMIACTTSFSASETSMDGAIPSGRSGW
jgi:hypothetical protein